jgi:hypothetical protein
MKPEMDNGQRVMFTDYRYLLVWGTEPIAIDR